jgi:uncharacterized protein with HEPN domain
MSRRDPNVRLLHMRDFARKAVELVRGKTPDDLALTHLVELVGEAASQVAPETQALYPEIPWPKIVSTRNRLIHGYDYVDNNILWETLRTNLPDLLAQLEKIVPPSPL